MTDRLAVIRQRLSITQPNPIRDAFDRELFAEIERLRGLLARLDIGLCPVCFRNRPAEPHYEACWLAAELKP